LKDYIQTRKLLRSSR